jgi:GNAT superfamily N-acetyltransferase
MITYAVERWTDILEEIRPFAPLHWAELAVTQDDVPLDFDWDRFAAMDAAGTLHTVTVRLDGHLVGYHISLIGGHLHYKSTKHAMVDLYYLLPEHRRTKMGVGLFQFAERALRQVGVVKIITGTKVHLPNDALFERLGYQCTDRTYAKILKEEPNEA